MDLDFRVAGLAEYEQMLFALGTAGARRAGKKALRQGANVIMKEARILAVAGHPGHPNKMTGRMVKSIYTHDRGVMGDNIVFSIDVKKLAFYARFVEFGTSRSRAFPFMRPAAENKAREAVGVIADVLRPAIELEWGRKA